MIEGEVGGRLPSKPSALESLAMAAAFRLWPG